MTPPSGALSAPDAGALDLTLRPGEQTTMGKVVLTCKSPLIEGQVVRTYVTVNYQDQITQFTHVAKGDMVVRVEPAS
jgi:hypothetical protein